MSTQSLTVPTRPALTASLTALLGAEGAEGARVTLLDREPNVYRSSFPTEIVTCRLPDDTVRRLFCKFSTAIDRCDHGARGGVEYEALIYEHLLRGLPLSLPGYYGTCSGPEDDGTWLLLEDLKSYCRVNESPDSQAMPVAAAWAARFHALIQERILDEQLAFLTRYDADYYAGWSRRVLEFGRSEIERHAWLPIVCRKFADMVPLLVEQPQTIIHGEYTPHNVLWNEGKIVPIDWETAAVGPGEIDLAHLLEDWDADTICSCMLSYRQTRWPNEDCPCFEQHFGAAQLYVAIRWLSSCLEGSDDETSWHLDEVRGIAERLGLI